MNIGAYQVKCFVLVNIVVCMVVRVTIMTVLVRMIGFIGTSATSSLNRTQVQCYCYSTHFQFTVAHALEFSVSTNRLLATDLITETSTSNHYEVFLSLRLQSLCTPLS
jgi:hypothetical protein